VTDAPLRILYSHRTKSADGQYVHIRALTDALRARACEIEIVGPDESGAAATRKLDGGEIASLRTGLPKPLYEAAEFSYSAIGYRRLAARAREIDPDLLYERYNLFYHAGVRLARARRLPFILEVNSPLAAERARHGGLALKGFARWSEGSIWRAADKVLPVTAELARMVEAAGVRPERIEVVWNGVEEHFLGDIDGAAARARLGLGRQLVLGFTGFARDWHGLDKIVRYLARAGRDDLHFLLVGDGDVAPGLKAEAARLGVADRLTITGVVQRDAVADYVAAFDVALQPASVVYASPLKLVEYMAQARAIVAPDQPNIREVMTDGVDGLLFAPDDEAALYRALDALLADAALRQRLGGEARLTVRRRNLTWAGNAARVEAIARALLAARQRSR
jgi:glycosyltransferase involved in cell wall biosynthesis